MIFFNLFVFALISSAFAAESTFQIPTYKMHKCIRTCDGKAMECEYDFYVEWYQTLSKACGACPQVLSHCNLPGCIPGQGTARSMTSVNRMFPGPAIQVCKGDTIKVRVHNYMTPGEALTIHWHGVPLWGGDAPMDGVPYVTQCPILGLSSFEYKFAAQPSGTFMYHAHTGFSMADGVAGAIIIRDQNDVLKDEYDVDDAIMFITDWNTELFADRFLSIWRNLGTISLADTGLVNGRGRHVATYAFDDFAMTGPTTYTPMAEIVVKPNQKNRIRLINNGIECAFRMTIRNHDIRVIATDAYPVVPIDAKALTSFSGEKYDFVVNADQTAGKYLIEFRGAGPCEHTKTFMAAVLTYEGNEADAQPTYPAFADLSNTGLTINAVEENATEEWYFLSTNVRAHANAAQQDVSGTPDHKFFLRVDFGTIPNHLATSATLGHAHELASAQINYITFVSPASPVLTQLKDIDQASLCSYDSKPNCSYTEYCHCTHALSVATNSLVEVILFDDGTTSDAYHPFHLHGHHFRTVGMGHHGQQAVTHDTLKQMDANGELTRNFVDPVWKETIHIPDAGYSIIRFKANNPGPWLLHCHLPIHAESGMILVFLVGDASEWPLAPANWPKCYAKSNSPKIDPHH